MKIFIASDIHGSYLYCKKMIEAFERENASKMLLLGDILYHGPRNDLPDGYDPKSVIELLNKYSSSILCVRGNCDTEVDQMVLKFPLMADYCVIAHNDRIIYATHGHIFNMDNLPPIQSGDILLCGHTHVPAWTEAGDKYYLNPGSVSIPKEGSCHGYMILDDNGFTWKDLDGNEYHSLCI